MRPLFASLCCIAVLVVGYGRTVLGCNMDPVAEIVSSYSQTICVGGTASFDAVGQNYGYYATGSHDPDNGPPYGAGNGIVEYYWDFGDGWASYSGTPTHTYTQAGNYWVQLRVTDDDDDTDYAGCWVHVVGVGTIQYDDPDTGWTDVPVTLYVYVGTSVSFKAIPSPSGATWPAGKPVWGGTAGATGTGDTTSVTFNALSANTTDYKTVTAECGNTFTVNVIVYDFAGVITPQDNFSGRSLNYLGLEEMVNLDFTTTPPQIPGNCVGGLEWKKGNPSQPGTLSNVNTDYGTALYDAGATAGTVVLDLVIKSGPSKGSWKMYPRDVIPPSGTRMTRTHPNTVRHEQWFASAGIQLYYWLDPTNVSFKYLTFGEGPVAPTNVSGFFLHCEPWNSYPNGTQIDDHPQGYFGAILGGSSTTGCRVQEPDHADTGDANPYAAGSFTWSIPPQYLDDTGARHNIGSTQDQVLTFQANGSATASKGGQSGSAALDAVTSGY